MSLPPARGSVEYMMLEDLVVAANGSDLGAVINMPFATMGGGAFAVVSDVSRNAGSYYVTVHIRQHPDPGGIISGAFMITNGEYVIGAHVPAEMLRPGFREEVMALRTVAKVIES